MGTAPARMCIGCRIRESQPQLIRVVESGGHIGVDLSFTASGRGAYVHPQPECIDTAVTRKAFARALRVPASLDVSAIVTYSSQLPK